MLSIQNNIIKILLIGIIIFISGCEKNFLNKEPQGKPTTETINSPKGVDKLLLGAYALLDGAGIQKGWPADHAYAASVKNWVWDCASDDAYIGSVSGDFRPGEKVELFIAEPGNELIEQKWKVMYDGVFRANETLRGIDEARSNLSDQQIKSFKGQAKFLRAWYHFQLQKIHYQIPYITENVKDPGKVRNDHPVWDEIEKDLQFAVENLPGSFEGEPGRATRWAAMAVKAYAHLFQHEYNEASSLLDQIIDSGNFKLVDHFYDNFKASTENNAESIFEIQASVNDGAELGLNGNADSWITNPMNRFVPTCCNMYQPSQDLVNAFKVDSSGLPLLGINGPKYNKENLKNDMNIPSNEKFVPTQHLLDPRLDWTVGRRGIPYLDWGIHTGKEWVRSQSNGGPYNTKKQMYTSANKSFAAHNGLPRATAINFRVYRFAQILIWRAECAVEANNLELARNLVNRVRARASDDLVKGRVTTYKFSRGTSVQVNWNKPAANYKLGQYKNFPSQEYARAAVRMELRLETALEGNRFFDLVRWDIDNKVINKYLNNDSKIRGFVSSVSYDPEKNDHWPIPQNQIEIQGKNILQQDPAY